MEPQRLRQQRVTLLTLRRAQPLLFQELESSRRHPKLGRCWISRAPAAAAKQPRVAPERLGQPVALVGLRSRVEVAVAAAVLPRVEVLDQGVAEALAAVEV